jgi:hypothetical protein
MAYKLERKKKISSKQSNDLIMTIAKHSNIDKNLWTKLRTDEDVKKFFEQEGKNFEELIEKCRNYYGKNVPLIENLAPSSFKVGIRGGGSISFIDNSTGKEQKREDAGEIIMSTYWSSYEEANDSLNRAVEYASFAHLQSAIEAGISSIEGYINYKAEQWNYKNSMNKLIDSKEQRVRLEDKIICWTKTITGKDFDRNTKCWSDFKELKLIRDNKRVHPKESSQSISHKDLAKLINRFSTGIAGMLVQLHLIFGDRIPRIIIRGYYSPNVEVI